jgi:DNA-binding CsgD family transcriptional regulator
MSSDTIKHAISRISEAALAPEGWPAALQAITKAVGAFGVGCLLSNKRTGGVEWASLAGFRLDVASYINYYAARDPYRPVLESARRRSWIQLSKCLPKTVLQSDEWYNDYAVKAGIGDIIGTRLFDSPSSTIILSVHRGIYQPPLTAAATASIRELYDPLSKATQLHAELRELGWKSAAALRALDQVAAGVIITDGDCRVVEMNRAAEDILRRDDGLMVRDGKLGAYRVFEHDKLARCIAHAALGKTATAIGRMLVRTRSGRVAYSLAVAPLGVELALYERPLAIILVGDPLARTLTETDLIEFFGLSPAESRVAAALLAGKKVRQIAVELDVQITTVRTQLSSIFQKVGAKNQADLIRMLLIVPVLPAGLREAK